MRIEIVNYREIWPSHFELQKKKISEVLGNQLLGIHHIGSTSVPGLSAKDIVDIQITVPALTADIEASLNSIGYRRLPYITGDHRPAGQDHIPDVELSKWFFKGDHPAVNLHVRLPGHFNQRYPLLCRDYLRAQPHAAKAYEEIKRQLARYFPDDIDAYYDVKDPVFDIIMNGAERWAELVNWKPESTD